ncbi:hypothetical protein EV359DRAFT_82829 [Lentinula novae-zelandiae]|nr:hypothetical protein EV359DRAFT_82829 [Lentinula novae-zelandiae]
MRHKKKQKTRNPTSKTPIPTAFRFSDVPAELKRELLLLMHTSIHDRKDLSVNQKYRLVLQLSLVSKLFKQILTPIIYQKLALLKPRTISRLCDFLRSNRAIGPTIQSLRLELAISTRTTPVQSNALKSVTEILSRCTPCTLSITIRYPTTIVALSTLNLSRVQNLTIDGYTYVHLGPNFFPAVQRLHLIFTPKCLVMNRLDFSTANNVTRLWLSIPDSIPIDTMDSILMKRFSPPPFLSQLFLESLSEQHPSPVSAELLNGSRSSYNTVVISRNPAAVQARDFPFVTFAMQCDDEESLWLRHSKST